MQDIRQRYLQQGYSTDAAALIINSFRPATWKDCNTYIKKKWKVNARLNNIEMLNSSVVYVSNFLASLFKDGASYDAVNAARSALSAFIPSASHATVGSRPDVCRLVKGTFEERPALPKYTDTLDVSQVLDPF